MSRLGERHPPLPGWGAGQQGHFEPLAGQVGRGGAGALGRRDREAARGAGGLAARVAHLPLHSGGDLGSQAGFWSRSDASGLCIKITVVERVAAAVLAAAGPVKEPPLWSRQVTGSRRLPHTLSQRARGAAVSPWAGSFVPTGTVTSKFSFSLKIWISYSGIKNQAPLPDAVSGEKVAAAV